MVIQRHVHMQDQVSGRVADIMHHQLGGNKATEGLSMLMGLTLIPLLMIWSLI